MVDELTPKTLISGQLPDPLNPSTTPASLLHRIGRDGIMVIADFSTILAMKPDHKAAVLAQFRRVFDGQYKRELGTGSHVPPEWKGRLTIVAAVTPAIDSHQSVFQSLGERFVIVRWPRADGVQAAVCAVTQDREAVKSELKEAIHRLLEGLPTVEPSLPEEILRKLASLSEIAVRGRTHVQRDNNKAIVQFPEAESPTRLAQQLAELSKGSALLDGRIIVNEHDYQIARRAAFDSMPPVRCKVLQALIAGQNLNTLAIPNSTRTYALQDLKALALLEEHGRLGQQYKLSADAVDWLEQAGIPVGGGQQQAA